MNSLLFLLIAIPSIEIFVMIKIGQNIGALTTVSLIFATAFIGIYLAKIEGLNTLRSGIYNLSILIFRITILLRFENTTNFSLIHDKID